MKYDTIDSELFVKNRARFTKKLKKNSVALFYSNDEMPRNGDATFPFRQNSELLWLSGIDQEQTVLVLCPDHPDASRREMLFLRETNEHIAVWEGHKYTKEEARKASGIQTVFWINELEAVLHNCLIFQENIYVNINENDRFSSDVPYQNLRMAQMLKEKYPAHKIRRSGPIMMELRAVKLQAEIDLMSKACSITEKAFRKVLSFTKPGVYEYEIEAEIIREFLRNRATGHAYSPIIASGANACVLHYIDNNNICMDGDLLLMDFGSEYANYTSDLSRTIPVNGKFTQRQKDVYNAVLHVMKESTAMLTVGNNLTDYHKIVGQLMEVELIKLGLLDEAEVKKQDPKAPLYKKYFMHGTSHYIGLDVHDIGSRHEPFKEGMVFTCEPGIYIPDENIGVRIENDIVVTSKGPVDLMASIPREVEEIESLMNG